MNPTTHRVVARMLAAAILLHAAGAGAGQRLAIASFRLSGERTSEPLRAKFENSLVGGLTAAGFDVVPPEEAAEKLANARGLAGCDTTACIRHLAVMLGVRFLVRASVDAVGATTFVVTVEMVDGGTGKQLDRRESTCSVCTLKEANDALSAAAAAIHPLRLLAAPAAPAVTVPAPPSVVAAPPVAPARRPFRLLAAGAAGVGALLLGAGIVELALDGRERSSRFGADGTLSVQRWSTGAGGIVFTTVGAALFVAAGALLWQDRAQRRVTADDPAR